MDHKLINCASTRARPTPRCDEIDVSGCVVFMKHTCTEQVDVLALCMFESGSDQGSGIR
jgi:hypothetical protein